MKRNKKAGIAVIALVLLVGIAAGAYELYSAGQDKEHKVPTTRVQRGDLRLDVHTTGDVRSPNSVAIAAPSIGGSLQIVTIVKMGTPIRKGNLVVEFDPSDQEYAMEQNRAKVLQAEQDIAKMKADAAVQAAQDKVALLKARFDVRRAELEVQKNELLGDIDARKNLLALEEAKRKLNQLQQDIKSRGVSVTSSIAVLQQRLNQAKLSMRQAQENIANLKVVSPIDGLVAVRENQENAGWLARIPGAVFPEFREGDLIRPGRFLADILDLNEMEVAIQISESDRANVNPGQPVQIKVNVAPGTVYTGKVKSIAGLASRRGWSSNAQRKFDAVIEITNGDMRLRRGVTAEVIIQGSALKDRLLLPRQCVMEKNGKQVVYVHTASGFEPREVKVINRNESQVAVENLAAGTEVALLNPEQNRKSKTRANNGPALGGAQ